jgi:hypothetical protein
MNTTSTPRMNAPLNPPEGGWRRSVAGSGKSGGSRAESGVWEARHDAEAASHLNAPRVNEGRGEVVILPSEPARNYFPQ